MLFVGLTQVADPRVQLLQRVEGPRADQDVQTVLAVRSEGSRQHIYHRRSCVRYLRVNAEKKSGRTGRPAAAVVATQDDLQSVAADGAVGLISVLVVTIQSLCEVVLQGHKRLSGEQIRGLVRTSHTAQSSSPYTSSTGRL